MSFYFLFLIFFVLENMIIPAITGPGYSLIISTFIISVFMYKRGWKPLAYMVLPFILAEEFFTGASFGKILYPMAITWLIYYLSDRSINMREQLSEDTSIRGFIIGSAFLCVFVLLYSLIFIFIHGGYDVNLGFTQSKEFLKNSPLSLAGWSIAISFIFKYVIQAK